MLDSNARCWYCDDRHGVTPIGLCERCLYDLRGQTTIPPGKMLHATGTLPEDVGPYRQPLAAEYRTWPSS